MKSVVDGLFFTANQHAAVNCGNVSGIEYRSNDDHGSSAPASGAVATLNIFTHFSVAHSFHIGISYVVPELKT
jgi:hypothetical protein